MSLQNLLERFEEKTRDAVVHKLFLIHTSHPKDLYDFLEDVNVDDYDRLFPDVIYDRLNKHSCKDILMEHGYSGFIAHCRLPKPTDIVLDNKGEISSFSSSHAYTVIFHCYGSTIENLLKDIEKQAERLFQFYVEKQREKFKA